MTIDLVMKFVISSVLNEYGSLSSLITGESGILILNSETHMLQNQTQIMTTGLGNPSVSVPRNRE